MRNANNSLLFTFKIEDVTIKKFIDTILTKNQRWFRLEN
jgi:hypothetical protein